MGLYRLDQNVWMDGCMEWIPLRLLWLVEQYFYGQAGRKGGGESVSPLCPAKPIVKILNQIFPIEIWLIDAQNPFYLIVRGLKNALFIFMPFTPLLYRYTAILLQSSSKP